jgi:hypothetical protein
MNLLEQFSDKNIYMSNQLQVTGTAIFSAAGQSLQLTSSSDVYLNVTRGASILNIGIDATGSFYNTSSSHRFFTNLGTINALTITAAGNIGIGTSSPSEKLDVIGGALAAGNGTIRTGITYSSLGLIGTFTNHDLGVITNGIEKLRVTSGGNVLIGTTTDAGYKLDVSSIGRFFNGDQGSARVIIQNTGSGGQAVNLIAGNPNVDQTGFSIAYGNTNFLRFNSTGIATFSSLAGSGSRTVTADANGTLSASSDSSLKQEDITHQIEGLAEILQLKPRAYKWLSDIEIRGKEAVTEIGFFADEVNPIIPSAAPKGKDDLYGFYDRAIIASLVKGMQEQQAQIEELKALISNK